MSKLGKDLEKINNINWELSKLINSDEVMVREFVRQLAMYCINTKLGLDIRIENYILTIKIYVNCAEYTLQSVEEITFELINNCVFDEVIGKIVHSALIRFDDVQEKLLKDSLYIKRSSK
jgi:hypothetical protein